MEKSPNAAISISTAGPPGHEKGILDCESKGCEWEKEWHEELPQAQEILQASGMVAPPHLFWKKAGG